MKVYNLRKNHTAFFSTGGTITKGKLAFKTRETDWLNTDSPILIPISIDSHFHEGISGDLKMSAFCSVLKKHVQGHITILMTERAHLNVLGLENGKEYALRSSLCRAHQLVDRYKHYFRDCDVQFWSSFICQDPSYQQSVDRITYFFQNDAIFRSHLISDAELTYTSERAELFSDRDLFIRAAISDIMEQCVCLLILVKKGYVFQFYPGHQYGAVEYINQLLLKSSLKMISVFLTIEKKTTSSLVAVG